MDVLIVNFLINAVKGGESVWTLFLETQDTKAPEVSLSSVI